jgi:Sec-independent protein translocase protein TatA
MDDFPQCLEAFSMKILILLIVVALVVVGVKWKLRKYAAEAALARRKSVERMKKQKQEALAQDAEVIWPVMIRPVTGKGSEAEAVEEPSMTSIEFEPSQRAG